jgi:hypothetical protein
MAQKLPVDLAKLRARCEETIALGTQINRAYLTFDPETTLALLNLIDEACQKYVTEQER